MTLAGCFDVFSTDEDFFGSDGDRAFVVPALSDGLRRVYEAVGPSSVPFWPGYYYADEQRPGGAPFEFRQGDLLVVEVREAAREHRDFRGETYAAILVATYLVPSGEPEQAIWLRTEFVDVERSMRVAYADERASYPYPNTSGYDEPWPFYRWGSRGDPGVVGQTVFSGLALDGDSVAVPFPRAVQLDYETNKKYRTTLDDGWYGELQFDVENEEWQEKDARRLILTGGRELTSTKSEQLQFVFARDEALPVEILHRGQGSDKTLRMVAVDVPSSFWSRLAVPDAFSWPPVDIGPPAQVGSEWSYFYPPEATEDYLPLTAREAIDFAWETDPALSSRALIGSREAQVCTARYSYIRGQGGFVHQWEVEYAFPSGDTHFFAVTQPGSRDQTTGNPQMADGTPRDFDAVICSYQEPSDLPEEHVTLDYIWQSSAEIVGNTPEMQGMTFELVQRTPAFVTVAWSLPHYYSEESGSSFGPVPALHWETNGDLFSYRGPELRPHGY